MNIQKQTINLSIGYFNIEGINDKSFQCKLSYLENKMTNDTEIFSKTWGECTCNKQLGEYTLLGIKSEKQLNTKKDRESGRGGGGGGGGIYSYILKNTLVML